MFLQELLMFSKVLCINSLFLPAFKQNFIYSCLVTYLLLMYFHSMKLFHKLWIAMIYNFTMPHIHRCYFIHIFLCKFEIPNINILFHSFLMNGFWNNNDSSLNIPSKYNLCRGFTIFFTNFC